MDSLTHILLGAAIGEATLGKQAGKKAMLWGALTATAPDLDVVAGIFLNDMDKIIFHRGITHSFFFILAISPLYGWIIGKLSRSDVHFLQWTFLAFLTQFTHALLDSFTSYGTQILLPFSSKAVALGTISVIDPIYTLPLLASVLFLLIKKADHPFRQKAAAIGIFISCAYLMLTIGNKVYVDHHFKKEFNAAGVAISAIETKPTMLNNLLWRGIARTDGDRYLTGYFSLADGSARIAFETIHGNHYLLEPYQNLRSVKRLIWVSNGFYQVEEREDGFIFNDLRFGRVAEFSGDDSPYAFSYMLWFDEQSGDFEVTRVQLRIDRDREGGSLRLLWDRIFGK